MLSSTIFKTYSVSAEYLLSTDIEGVGRRKFLTLRNAQTFSRIKSIRSIYGDSVTVLNDQLVAVGDHEKTTLYNAQTLEPICVIPFIIYYATYLSADHLIGVSRDPALNDYSLVVINIHRPTDLYYLITHEKNKIRQIMSLGKNLFILARRVENDYYLEKNVFDENYQLKTHTLQIASLVKNRSFSCMFLLNSNRLLTIDTTNPPGYSPYANESYGSIWDIKSLTQVKRFKIVSFGLYEVKILPDKQSILFRDEITYIRFEPTYKKIYFFDLRTEVLSSISFTRNISDFCVLPYQQFFDLKPATHLQVIHPHEKGLFHTSENPVYSSFAIVTTEDDRGYISISEPKTITAVILHNQYIIDCLKALGLLHDNITTSIIDYLNKEFTSITTPFDDIPIPLEPPVRIKDPEPSITHATATIPTAAATCTTVSAPTTALSDSHSSSSSSSRLDYLVLMRLGIFRRKHADGKSTDDRIKYQYT